MSVLKMLDKPINFFYTLKKLDILPFNKNRVFIHMAVKKNARLSQIKNALLAYVTENGLHAGDRLPSEGDLAKFLGISRNTLRETYVALESEGSIIRRHGIGTFVAQPPMIQDSLNAFSSFARIVEEAGYTPHFTILEMGEVFAPPPIYNTFQITEPATVFFMKRLVLADQTPAIYLNDYFSPVIQANQLPWEDFDGGNVVDFLIATLESPPHQLHSHIKAVSIVGDAAVYLEIADYSPALKVQSIIYDMHHRPITFSNIWFNPAIVEFRNRY